MPPAVAADSPTAITGTGSGRERPSRFRPRRSWLMDALVVAVFLAGAASSRLFEPIQDPTFWILVTVTAVVLCGRYRWRIPARWRQPAFLQQLSGPVITVVVITGLLMLSVALSSHTDGFEFALAFALYAVVRTHSPRTAEATLVVINVLASAAILLWGRNTASGSTPDLDLLIASAGAILGLSFIAMAVGTLRTEPESSAPFTPTQRRGPVRRFFHRRPRMIDLLVVFWLGVGVTMNAPLLSEPEWLWWLTMVTALGLFLRRRSPAVAFAIALLATVTATGLTGSTAGIDLAVAIGVYAVTVTSSTLMAWAALAAANLFTFTGLWFWGSSSLAEFVGDYDQAAGDVDLRLGAGIGMGVVTLAALAIGTTVRNRRDHVQRLLDRANQLALERDQMDQIAVASERARIAREMHDVVAHSVQVMIALSDGAQAMIPSQPQRAEHALTEASTVGRNALDDMRRILGVLRDEDEGAELEPQPEAFDLEQLVDRYRSAGLPVTYTVSGPLLPEDSGLHLALYRIVQEGLTNVLRYAPLAPTITVMMHRSSDQVEVTITNAFGPSDPPQSTQQLGAGRGLIGMRERVAAYDGAVTAGPHLDGWRVHATLSLAKKEDHGDHSSTRR